MSGDPEVENSVAPRLVTSGPGFIPSLAIGAPGIRKACCPDPLKQPLPILS